jgi:hypothetical protein
MDNKSTRCDEFFYQGIGRNILWSRVVLISKEQKAIKLKVKKWK